MRAALAVFLRGEHETARLQLLGRLLEGAHGFLVEALLLREAIEPHRVRPLHLGEKAPRGRGQSLERSRAGDVEREAEDRRPERAMDEGHLPLDELHEEHVGVVVELARQPEDLAALRMPPPASGNGLARDLARERRHGAAGARHRHDAALLEQFQRIGDRLHFMSGGGRDTGAGP